MPTTLLRTALAGSLAFLIAGCQGAMFSTYNAITPARNVDTRAGIVFDRKHDLKADVYMPLDKAAADGAPVVVFFYGGSWRNGSRGWYRFIGKQLAAQGVIAVLPDYQKYPEVRFPTFIEDAARAVVWAQRTYGGDGRKVFIAGHSAGAHIAALVGTDARYLAAEGGSLTSIAGVVGYSGVYDFLPLTDTTLQATFGDRARWPDSQPINFVDGDEPPFFLVHGRNDRIVWPVNSQSLAGALRARGVPVEFMLREDFGHYAAAIGFARNADDEVTQHLLAFLRDPPPRR